jgi:hypothetical protein
MAALQTGTIVLRKYRVDRLRVDGGDVSLYDATDTIHARHVCIKAFRSDARFARDAKGPNVVDVGHTAGVGYVVVGDPGSKIVKPKPKIPRPRRAPPPLPPKKKATSTPPPLPTRIVEHDFVRVCAGSSPGDDETPPPLPMMDPTVLDVRIDDDAAIAAMRSSPSRLAWVAIVLCAVLCAVGAWYMSAPRLIVPASHVSATLPIAVPETTATSPSDTDTEPPPQATAAPAPSANATTTTRARRPRVDPLTL